jgi:signal transduction histidine kinase
MSAPSDQVQPIIGVRTYRSWAIDFAVAAAVAAVEIGGAYAVGVHHGRHVTFAGLALVSTGAAALVLRRRFPVLVLAVTYSATFAYLATQEHTGPAWMSVIVAIGTAVYLGKRAAALGFVVAGYVGFLWGPMLDGKHGPPATFALSLGAGLAFLLGLSEWVRLRRQRSHALARSREQEALRHASEQRMAMARDLHDVVAHNISVINVQANTALHLMDRQPDRARAALAIINEVSKQALVELRSILGVLRQVDEDPPLGPTPSLAALGALLATAKAAGLDVRLQEEGERRPLPSEVDVAAYRILQEALTNSARHSNGDHTRVRIAFSTADLLLEVIDEGRARGSTARVPINGFGNGIAGMTERARGLGGTLDAAPRNGGGYLVRAKIPLNGIGQ